MTTDERLRHFLQGKCIPQRFIHLMHDSAFPYRLVDFTFKDRSKIVSHDHRISSKSHLLASSS